MCDDPLCHSRWWVAHVTPWHPSDREFAWVLAEKCPDREPDQIAKYDWEDQKLAAVSTLLQRKACQELTGIPAESVELKRTRGRKPFAVVPRDDARPNFNFNASGSFGPKSSL